MTNIDLYVPDWDDDAEINYAVQVIEMLTRNGYRVDKFVVVPQDQDWPWPPD